MTQPPGPGYAPGPNTSNPYPNPYPHAGQGNPYGPGPTGHPAPPQMPYSPAGPTGYPPPYPPAYPSPQWNPNQPVPNPNAYTSWLDRALAYVIDQVPVFGILFVGYGILMGIVAAATSSGEPSDGVVALIVLATLALFAATLAFPVWNYGYRQGKTGQSIGKQVMKFKVISEKTGQPIGFGMALLRQVAHFVDSIFYIGYLMPLWDNKRQTIADKLVATVCVPAPVTAPAPPVFPGPQGGPNPYGYPPR
ncbi:RDD family protein [Mycobacterium sp. E802]|uniref:RDD family protein n=1 Tax=Mycobacterium sp. E802 TaxID=1834152 RepID=UPI0009ED9965|nr:RDD family protein [Mycobacterium sp. E802]